MSGFFSRLKQRARLLLAGSALLFTHALIPTVVGAQGPDAKDGRIVGRIVDESTAQPLSGVQVYLPGTELGTLTDMNGRYLIMKVPPGSHDLVAEMLGFAQKTVTGVQVD